MTMNRSSNDKRFLIFMFLLLSLYSGIGVNAQQQTTSTNSTSDNNNNSPTISPYPSISPYPTISLYPTYEDICYICGDINNELVDSNQTINIQNETLLCYDLFIGGINHMIPTSYCLYIQQAGCNCTTPYIPPTIAPTISISPSVSSKPTGIITYYPTITSWPTLTSLPTQINKCNICGNHDQYELLINNYTNDSTTATSRNTVNDILKSNETIRFNGILFNCYEVYEDGIKGYIPIDTCTAFQQRIEHIQNDSTTLLSEKETGCTCIPINNINNSINSTTTNNTNESPVTSPTTNTSNNSSNDSTNAAAATSSGGTLSLMMITTMSIFIITILIQQQSIIMLL